jgi:threonine/homoserine/homoserine lactone efflux protein
MLIADALPAFVIAGFALTGSPGPATLSLAAAGAAFGLRRSLGLAAGIIAGVLAVMMVTATGLTGLVLAQPVFGPVVKSLAVAYMVYLAWCIATAPPMGDAAQDGHAPTFLGGIFLGVGNPKAYAAMAALFSGFVLSADGVVADAGFKVLILLAIMVIVDVAWLLVGSALARVMRHPALSRTINIAFAVALLASVAVGFL